LDGTRLVRCTDIIFIIFVSTNLFGMRSNIDDRKGGLARS